MNVRNRVNGYYGNTFVLGCAQSSAREGEDFGLLMALQWLHEEGWTNVVIELDCKVVVDYINSTLPELSEFEKSLIIVRSSYC